MGSSAQDLNNSRRSKRHHDRRSHGNVDWASIQAQLLMEAIRLVAKSGGALRFGYTRDQGAYAVGVYGEDDPYTEYFHSPDDLSEFLRELIRDYGDDTGTALKIGV